jgi:RNA polymerase sigma-70 factor (ECF subfamily)
VDARDEPSDADPVVAIYDRALPQVFGYLLLRCRNVVVAEDLTTETFMAAVAASRESRLDVNVAWLIGIARHKLVDHWRRVTREQRGLAAVTASTDAVDDPWEEWIDTEVARAALAQISDQHRVALTLRYLDGLPVADVAELVGRSLHATETLLVRARAALRRVYREQESPNG